MLKCWYRRYPLQNWSKDDTDAEKFSIERNGVKWHTWSHWLLGNIFPTYSESGAVRRYPIVLSKRFLKENGTRRSATKRNITGTTKTKPLVTCVVLRPTVGIVSLSDLFLPSEIVRNSVFFPMQNPINHNKDKAQYYQSKTGWQTGSLQANQREIHLLLPETTWANKILAPR